MASIPIQTTSSTMWWRRLDRYDRVLLFIALLTVFDRAWMVGTTMHHASDDLAVVWLGAVDYAHATFHEPFFYGQDYGVMLEALIAAPLVAMGGDPVKLVPIIFGFFAIAPFLSFAWWHRLRGEPASAMVFAAMPLLLPVEHGLQITALNGLAVLALVPLALRVERPAQRTLLLALVLSLAVFVNPNAALMALPLLVELLFHYRWRKEICAALIAGAVPAIALWLLSRAFYAAHGEAMVNTIFDWRMHFKPYMIPEAVQRLDAHFAWTAPLSGNTASIGPLMLGLSAVLLFKQKTHAAAWATIAAILLIILSFCFAKVHDGSGSIFFPLSRIFLGMPLLLAWVFSKLDTGPIRTGWFLGVIAVIASLHAAHRISTAQATFQAALNAQEGLPLRTWPIGPMKDRCGVVAELAERTRVDAVIILRNEDPFAAQFMSYAIPVFHPDAPATWMVGYDRRDLQRGPQRKQVVNRVLLVGSTDPDLTKAAALGPVYVKRMSRPRCILALQKGRMIGDVIEALR